MWAAVQNSVRRRSVYPGQQHLQTAWAATTSTQESRPWVLVQREAGGTTTAVGGGDRAPRLEHRYDVRAGEQGSVEAAPVLSLRRLRQVAVSQLQVSWFRLPRCHCGACHAACTRCAADSAAGRPAHFMQPNGYPSAPRAAPTGHFSAQRLPAHRGAALPAQHAVAGGAPHLRIRQRRCAAADSLLLPLCC